MKKRLARLTALLMATAMMVTAVGCGKTTSSATDGDSNTAQSSETADAASDGEKKVITITWWGGQERHDLTQQVLDLYTSEHPDIEFEAVPAGWDGYFEKLSTQAASGSMPDIVQMDYLYISTYAQNGSLADMQEFVDNGTIDVANIDANILSTGNIGGAQVGFPLSTSLLSAVYNPSVFEEAGVEVPTADWTWSDFMSVTQSIVDTTGKYGASMTPITDTNLFNYWVRQHGVSLFSEDNKTLGFEDDALTVDYFTMWDQMMDSDAVPSPDEYETIQTLGDEAAPIVTNDAGITVEWNNYANKVSGSNDTLKLVTPPTSDDAEGSNGLWLKPGMFYSIADTSEVKQEAAEFLNWFINSEEANDIMLGERGVPVSSTVREHMVSSGELSEAQIDMFNYVDEASKVCGETPAPDPVGISEVNAAFAEAASQVFYDLMSPEDAAAQFRSQANEILTRNN